MQKPNNMALTPIMLEGSDRYNCFQTEPIAPPLHWVLSRPNCEQKQIQRRKIRRQTLITTAKTTGLVSKKNTTGVNKTNRKMRTNLPLPCSLCVVLLNRLCVFSCVTRPVVFRVSVDALSTPWNLLLVRMDDIKPNAAAVLGSDPETIAYPRSLKQCVNPRHCYWFCNTALLRIWQCATRCR